MFFSVYLELINSLISILLCNIVLLHQEQIGPVLFLNDEFNLPHELSGNKGFLFITLPFRWTSVTGQIHPFKHGQLHYIYSWICLSWVSYERAGCGWFYSLSELWGTLQSREASENNFLFIIPFLKITVSLAAGCCSALAQTELCCFLKHLC